MPHSTHARLSAEGFAVAPDLDDPTAVLTLLYGDLAPRLVAARAVRHFLDHVALPPLDAALANLSFGRHHVYAAQPAAPRPRPTGVRVRVGGIDDLDAIARIARVEIEHRATPPIYSPPDQRSLDDVAAELRALRDRGGRAHADARVAGAALPRPIRSSPGMVPGNGRPA